MSALQSHILDDVECLDGDGTRALQEKRLRITLQRAHRSPLYGQRLSAILGFDATEESSAYQAFGIDDLERLPTTSKSDLRAVESIEDALAVPLNRIRRWHTSSGTTGRRTPMGYTAADLETWGRLIRRNLAATGIGSGTRVHNAYGYGLFTGGLGFETGLAQAGATVLPASSTPTVLEHLELMREHRAQVLLSTPGLALAVTETVESDASLRPPELRAGIFGGDGWSPVLRRRIESGLQIRAHDTYGLSEVLGPGVAHACSERSNGLHLYSDAFLLEVLKPEDGLPLTPGTTGELVLTTLDHEASPRLRYRTGDRVAVDMTPCVCGRTTPRLTNIVRASDIRIYAGRALAPNDIEAALLGVDTAAGTFRIVAPEPEHDRLQLEVEPGIPESGGFAEQVRRAVESRLDVPVSVRVLKSGTLTRSLGKRARLVEQPFS